MQSETVSYILLSEKYPKHKITINRWLTDHYKITHMSHLFVKIIEEKENTILIDFDTQMPCKCRIPRSQFEITPTTKEDLWTVYKSGWD